MTSNALFHSPRPDSLSRFSNKKHFGDLQPLEFPANSGHTVGILFLSLAG